jgi:hypothetical protein
MITQPHKLVPNTQTDEMELATANTFNKIDVILASLKHISIGIQFSLCSSTGEIERSAIIRELEEIDKLVSAVEKMRDEEINQKYNITQERIDSGSYLPVAYQSRMRIDEDGYNFGDWYYVSKGTHEDHLRVPINADWEYETRALYTQSK